jgi:hypothetical protein
MLVAGCTIAPVRAAPDSTNNNFRPPTLVPTPLPPTATPTLLPGESMPVGDSVCLDNLSYIADVTIPDGTKVAPSSTIDKRWEVKNSGNCNWEEGYQIRLVSNQALGAKETQTLIPARSGSQVEIRIVFTAPEEEGKYRSAWQAFNSQGAAFGDPVYIEIMVEKNN